MRAPGCHRGDAEHMSPGMNISPLRAWGSYPTDSVRPGSPAAHKLDADTTQAVTSAKSGDPEALRFLYACYADRIYGYVLSMVRDRDTAYEATQHVFLKLRTIICTYEPRESPFDSWLMRIARDVTIDHLGRQRGGRGLQDEPDNVVVLPAPGSVPAERVAAS